MPQTVAPLPMGQEPAPNRKRWKRHECDFLRDSGLLTGHYELIDGQIIVKMGQKPPHAYAVRALVAWLIRVFGTLHVRCQLPIGVASEDEEYNEPEPDAAVTARPAAAFAAQHPGPADLALVAEVSDTTLRFDRSTKAAIYARAGICEYWVVDIVGRQVFVHRQPTAGGYADITSYGPDERIATLARPDEWVHVADLLPPAD